MSLLSVDEALEKLLKGAEPLGVENLPLTHINGRILARDLVSKRTHPPFNASAMDGYAVKYADASRIGQQLEIVGVAAAGHSFNGRFSKGQTVRIFTGAPVPDDGDTILIQEDTRKLNDNLIEVCSPAQKGRHIRRAGIDFLKGDMLLRKYRPMDYSAITLAASMNYNKIPVVKKPLVCVLATGDELLAPGQAPGPDQIIASNTYGIMALATTAGGACHDLGIAKDTLDAIKSRVQEALDRKADILVTIGGASVGEHDLVHQALIDMGMELDFWKVAMRPGKPLMVGTLDGMRVVGLPGNPASSLVTAILFLTPLVRKLAGHHAYPVIRQAKTTISLSANDHRQEYMRAHIITNENNELKVTPFSQQDSSLIRIFSDANGLLIRPQYAKAAKIGEFCDVIQFNNQSD